jgi:pyridoxamine 5'-phosphate oxidase
MEDLHEVRKEYTLARLEPDHLDPNPIAQFRYWLNEAIKEGIPDPTAMILATADKQGRPSSRVVLLKEVDAEGFTFFTNYESKKGLQLQENPFASLLFFWPSMERQIRIEGSVSRTSRKKSDAYFLSRPEGSKIGAWASPQSRRIPNREYLEHLENDYSTLFRSKPAERPEHWGGFTLTPVSMEFWQGRENRLHDRFEYSLNGNMWEIYRLAP